MADTLGKRNPFRHRGYVYDEETELYYLCSRYYRPEWNRFINADEVNDIFVVCRVDNCFAYCNCCPTMYIDEDGLVGKIIDLGTVGSSELILRVLAMERRGTFTSAKRADRSFHKMPMALLVMDWEVLRPNGCGKNSKK